MTNCYPVVVTNFIILSQPSEAMKVADWAQIIAIFISTAAIYFGLHGVWRQLWLNVFVAFTQRYSDIFRDAPDSLRDPNFSFEALEKEEKAEVLSIVRRYLNLCSEEFYLKQKKVLIMMLGKSGFSG